MTVDRVFRLTKFFEQESKWCMSKKYFYDDYNTFSKQLTKHKRQALILTWRLLSEEFINGTWVKLEDWVRMNP